jgi:hypothetical protein
MDLLPFFQWCYQTDIGVTIRNSVWLFPAIEAFHLLGFGLTAGAVLVVNLRLLGVGLGRQPVAQIAASAEPWLMLGVAMMVVSGVPLFLAESIKCLYSFAFWVKMICLLLVLLFTFTLYRHVTRTKSASDRTSVAREGAVQRLPSRRRTRRGSAVYEFYRQQYRHSRESTAALLWRESV